MNLVNSSPTMTQAEFAAHRGVRPSAVSNWKKAGLLVLVPGKGRQQLVDVAATEAKLDTAVDPLRGRPPADLPSKSASTELGELRVDLLRAQAVRIRMDNAKRAGELVSLVDFQAVAAGWGRKVRERLNAVVRMSAETLAAKSSPADVRAFLEVEIDKALESIALEADEVTADAAQLVDADLDADTQAALEA